MKRFATAIALVCVLMGTAFAGDIPCAPAPPPPPPAPAAADGDMGAGGFAEEIADQIALAIAGIFAG